MCWPCDTAVRGVIVVYAPTDMLAYGAKPANDWPSFVGLGRRIGIVRRGKDRTWPEIECRLFGAHAAQDPKAPGASRRSPTLARRVRRRC